MTAMAPVPWGVGRVFEHRFLQYRRSFRATIFSSFLTPVLFLASMGLGLGTYVDASGNQALGGVPYIAFLAPGLLAAACMQSAAFEAAFPIMAGLEWTRVFHAMHATPINGRDIALGNLAWIAARMLLVATIFTIVIVLFGAAASPLVVLAIPVAALTGLAFAAPIVAFSATQRTPDKFNVALPLRDHPAVPVLRHVLPGRVAADAPPAAGLDHAAVAWGGAVSRPVARDDR